MSTIDEIGDDFIEMLKTHGRALGMDLKANLEDAGQFAKETLQQLAVAVGEPGYDRAVEAATHAILLRATADGITSADQFDAKTVAVWTSILTFGARALDVVL
jgi:hypothetical protein